MIELMVSVVEAVPAAYVLSPGYLPVIDSTPTGSKLVVIVVWPAALNAVVVPVKGVVPL
jgi:hypothetical protein